MILFLKLSRSMVYSNCKMIGLYVYMIETNADPQIEIDVEAKRSSKPLLSMLLNFFNDDWIAITLIDTMHLCTILCMFVLVWFSCQTNTYESQEWHRYVWKSVDKCMKLHQGIQDLVTQSATFTKCYQDTWEERMKVKTLVKESPMSKHFLVTPYSYSQLSYRGVHSTTIQITVHRLFKLELTVTRLDLNQSVPGCTHGALSVSNFFHTFTRKRVNAI